ncbi:hypothetical protein DEO72_LG9g1028 [Vigna unguiculata]|uniref:Uncharacterized protein n=1 Tax=Vigna unguiculata TaxID=3917 RepID=A0A4D6N0R8_VIGUN|nr:hypothetical protein DEO72_LG9g1028 [Vigna unguiculata]
MSKPICLGFELSEAISFHRVKKTQIFSHRSSTHSALLLLRSLHTRSTLPLRASPSYRLHRHCTVKEVSGVTTSSSSSTNHHRYFVAAFVPPAPSRGRCTTTASSRSRCIFEQPSPTSACTAATPHRRGGCSDVATASIAFV